MIKRALFILLFSMTWSTVALPKAYAADTIAYLPENIRGTWARNGCDDPHNVLLFTKRFHMEHRSDSNYLWRFEPILRHQDIYRIGIPTITGNAFETGRPSDLKVDQETGDLMKYIIPRFVPADPTQRTNPFETKKSLDLTFYKYCPTLETERPALDRAGLEAIRALDRIDMVCGNIPVEQSPACQTEIFSFFDTDKNEKLSQEELENAYEQIVFVSVSQGCDFATYYPEQARILAPKIAETLLANVDKDENRELSLEELQENWPDRGLTTQIDTFYGFIDNLSQLLPFLPDGTPLPECQCIAVETGN